MEKTLLEELQIYETDIDGALYRFSGDKQFYASLLMGFLLDPTFSELKKSLDDKDWDAAFTAAHALKGLAGNLGFTPLFHSIGELVILIRAGKLNEFNLAFLKVEHCYNDIVAVISNYQKTKQEEEI